MFLKMCSFWTWRTPCWTHTCSLSQDQDCFSDGNAWSSQAFQTTKMSSPPTALRDRSGTSYSRVNRMERLKVRVSRRENERVSCCLQCSTAGYWHSHIKRNKHFSPNLGHKRRKQKREREQRGGHRNQPGKTDKGSDNQTGGQIRQGEWDTDQNTGKNK